MSAYKLPSETMLEPQEILGALILTGLIGCSLSTDWQLVVYRSQFSYECHNDYFPNLERCAPKPFQSVPAPNQQLATSAVAIVPPPEAVQAIPIPPPSLVQTTCVPVTESSQPPAVQPPVVAPSVPTPVSPRIVLSVPKRARWQLEEYSMGLKAMTGKRYDAAVANFTAVVKEVPDDPVGHYCLAAAYYGLHQEQEAWREVQAAAALEQLHPVTSWGGTMERLQGRPRVWIEKVRPQLVYR